MPIAINDVPEDSDELHALVETARKEFWTNSDELRQCAAQMRAMLREGLRDAGWGWWEARTTAWLVTNKLVIAARFQEDSAKQVLAAMNTFNEKIIAHKQAETVKSGKRFKV